LCAELAFTYDIFGGIMKNRSVAAVVLLSIITFGIYYLVWFVKTKNEMNKTYGTQIPSAIMLIIPVMNIIWMWKWAAGVEKATQGKQSQTMAFVLVLLLSLIGVAIIQSEFNKQGQQIPEARVAV
jgi:hypothetical protein